MVEEEKFFAWLDGELGPEEAARVEAEVELDAQLSRKAREHRAMTARLHGAFDPIASEPLPGRIAAATRAPGNVVDFPPRAMTAGTRPSGGIPQWAAMAAALALGIAVGTMVNTGTSAPVEVRGGNLYAAATVGQALDRQLASSEGRDVRIGLTFRDRAGAICRTFITAGSNGLACRDADRWKVQGLFAAPEGQSTDYRMAAGADPQLMGLVDERIAGEPFDAEQERSAHARGWR